MTRSTCARRSAVHSCQRLQVCRPRHCRHLNGRQLPSNFLVETACLLAYRDMPRACLDSTKQRWITSRVLLSWCGSKFPLTRCGLLSRNRAEFQIAKLSGSLWCAIGGGFRTLALHHVASRSGVGASGSLRPLCPVRLGRHRPRPRLVLRAPPSLLPLLRGRPSRSQEDRRRTQPCPWRWPPWSISCRASWGRC